MGPTTTEPVTTDGIESGIEGQLCFDMQCNKYKNRIDIQLVWGEYLTFILFCYPVYWVAVYENGRHADVDLRIFKIRYLKNSSNSSLPSEHYHIKISEQ